MGWFGDDEEPKGNYSDACLLMDYFDIFANKSVNELNPTGWRNFTCINTSPGSGAFEIIAKLTSREGMNAFMNISPSALALLQPKIRIYKLFYSSPHSKTHEKELIFDDFYIKNNIDSMVGGKRRRIGGSGLKEIAWEFAGTNPAEADKCIKVDLKFEFQSMLDLLGDRFDAATEELIDGASMGDLEGEANFIDLILHPPMLAESFGSKARSAEDNNEYVPKFYRIKVVIGWAWPEGDIPGMTSSEAGDLRDELKRMNLAMVLNLVSHSFDIKENGGISLSIEYVGSLEETINSNAANILDIKSKIEGSQEDITDSWLGGGTTAAEAGEEVQGTKQRIQDLEEYINCLNLSKDADSDQVEAAGKEIDDLKEEVKEREEQIENFTLDVKRDAYKQFLELLQEQILSIDTGEDLVEEWMKSLDSTVRPDLGFDSSEITREAPDSAEEAVEQIEDGIEEMQDGDDPDGVDWYVPFDEGTAEGRFEEVSREAKETAVDPEKDRIHYIYFGDILNIACNMMNETYNEQADRMRIICGPIIASHPRNDRRVYMNLADVPIPYSDFQNFFFETVVRKQLASYPLRQFINDILERLVRKVLQPRECFPANKSQRAVQIGLTNFTISDITYGIVTGQGNRAHLDAISIPPGANDNNGNNGPKEVNCLLLYATSHMASDLKGDVKDDREKGIYHYFIGAEGGIVKSISFNRSDVQGLREARQAENRNLGQIRDVYNASVKLIGNSIYIPGMKIFLHPPYGFGDPTKAPTAKDGEKSLNGGSLANLLGIGGYYDVIKINSVISRGGQYETELDCIFAQSGAPQETAEDSCKKKVETIESSAPVVSDTGWFGDWF